MDQTDLHTKQYVGLYIYRDQTDLHTIQYVGIIYIGTKLTYTPYST